MEIMAEHQPEEEEDGGQKDDEEQEQEEDQGHNPAWERLQHGVAWDPWPN